MATKKAVKEEKSVKPIHLLMESELLGQIEDYRFKQRFSTRIDAIKALLRIGLESAKKGKG